MVDFSATESGLGYLYQARYALWQLLSGSEDQELVLETLDDIVLEDSGSPKELLQTKHHSTLAKLTDTSVELWKTIRIWSTHIHDKAIKVPPTKLTLVSTATAPDSSIAAQLRPGVDRDVKAIVKALLRTADESKNKDLSSAFAAFKKLDDLEREALVSAITVLDGSQNISDTADKIRELIRTSVDRPHREALFERLEGWWFGKVVAQLQGMAKPIVGYEAIDKLRDIANQFGPESLPIDFLEAKPDTIDARRDERIFVVQLREISVSTARIEKAIVDFYRAFEQRSKWAREDLLIGDEVEIYERRLIDEWERVALDMTEDLPADVAEDELKKVGRRIFRWADEQDFRIRQNVSESYVMRGSYHILANENLPRVWWHPKFVDRVEKILSKRVATA